MRLIINVDMVDNQPMIERHLAGPLRDALADTPAVLVNGPRQTGKSTLVLSREVNEPPRRYLTFDDPGVLAAARADPAGFLAGLELPVTLDEVQQVPELFPVIKANIDRRRTPGQFLMTGSTNVMLLPKISESLAGRVEILTLWPFSQGELEGVRENFIDALFARERQPWAGAMKAIAPKELWQTVSAGGYPPAIARQSAARRDAWFASYITTMLQRDIRDLANLADAAAVPRLLAAVAARAGGLVNFADLSRTIGLPQTTLKRYFALLEGTFLVQLLPPWTRNLGARVIQTPKVYLNDSGLLIHALAATVERLASQGSLAGAALENFVVMELRKQCAWSKTKPQVFYWRTASGREVDIVLEDRAGRVAGVEVKSAATLASGDVGGLRALAEAAGRHWVRGVVLYPGAQTVPFAANLHGVPLRRLWTT